MVKNFGISFGWQVPMLTIINGLVLLLVAYWMVKKRSIPLGLIFLGGFLNWWERLNYGYVTDYWRIMGTNIYNNVNDWLIFVGVVWFLWTSRK